MDPDSVKSAKLKVISLMKQLSDREYQERVWIKKKGPETGSYGDLNCLLMDFMELVIKHPTEFGFSSTSNALVNVLYQVWEKYDESAPEDDSEIVRDPKWQEVRLLAKKVLESLQADMLKDKS